ncbi:polysaccharide biosynthesis tyrosine autokinase [Deinococcus wulumuqiensis]|uniref:polysaccharide biosynthesis tyrosine autokinase n=1 Tax=Deinococcus wulumuqiensis TaxID=980427 RepID=UPI001F1C5988|nr:polysaccharide biosynthesis tyrosine autokinase [Deinococcus wulumuqiensis]
MAKTTALPQAVRQEISADLQKELQERELRTIELSSRLDLSANGIYTVTAKGPSAAAATVLADAAAQSLLNWDRGRALSSLKRAERSLRAQLAEVDRQLATEDLDEVDRQTLIAARANTQRNLAQTSIQTEGVAGSLELVAPAVEPLRPVAPRPTRNAVLAGLLTLLLGTGLAALRTVTDRTVRGEDDLLQLGFPVLGNIPRLRQRDIVMSGIVRAARAAGLYEAVGFLRVNLLSQLSERQGQRVMVTSTAPGEGKSSLTATLADGLASSGQRVLIIDADLRRGAQQEVWDKYEREHRWVQLCGEGGVRTFQEALRQPEHVQVMEAEANVHVLPAGPGLHDSLALLNRADLGTLLSRWSAGYDLVLIDSPPLLAIADGLVLGKHVDGVLLIAEEGRTSVQMVRQAIRRAQGSGLPMLGFILNKVSASSRDSYSYGYGYSPRKQGAQ